MINYIPANTPWQPKPLTPIALSPIIAMSSGIIKGVQMVKIRLTRVGRKKKPSYRVVVADVQSPRDGSFIEIIGHYDPLTDPPTVVVDEEKALKWLRQGAQPTEPVARLLDKLGILERLKTESAA
jgi:small subunit ribosomal protein S16